MIARLWRGAARNAAAYLRHLDGKVLPALRTIPGFQGLRVLRREREILVMTFWDSMDAIRAFAGDEPEKAVVEPEARAVLVEFDDFARHYEVER
jgi:heme-degrading monooxygenase HmoA